MFPYQLRIKAKSLAAESKIIRKDERRSLDLARSMVPSEARSSLYKRYHDLNGHRRIIVRSAARETLLAYAYLRGKPYDTLEGSRKSEASWSKVYDMVKRYGTKAQLDVFLDWIPESSTFAADYLRRQHNKTAQ